VVSVFKYLLYCSGMPIFFCSGTNYSQAFGLQLNEGLVWNVSRVKLILCLQDLRFALDWSKSAWFKTVLVIYSIIAICILGVQALSIFGIMQAALVSYACLMVLLIFCIGSALVASYCTPSFLFVLFIFVYCMVRNWLSTWYTRTDGRKVTRSLANLDSSDQFEPVILQVYTKSLSIYFSCAYHLLPL
jgi:hypothetical protein